MTWRHFTAYELDELRAHVAEGGIGVHDNPFGTAWAKGRAAHLYAPGMATLVAAGQLLGMNRRWMHHARSGTHYDLKGAKLDHALRLCEEAA